MKKCARAKHLTPKKFEQHQRNTESRIESKPVEQKFPRPTLETHLADGHHLCLSLAHTSASHIIAQPAAPRQLMLALSIIQLGVRTAENRLSDRLPRSTPRGARHYIGIIVTDCSARR